MDTTVSERLQFLEAQLCSPGQLGTKPTYMNPSQAFHQRPVHMGLAYKIEDYIIFWVKGSIVTTAKYVLFFSNDTGQVTEVV